MRLIYNYQTTSMYIYNEVSEPEVPDVFPLDQNCLVYDISHWTAGDFSEFFQAAMEDQAAILEKTESHDPGEVF